MSTGVDNTLYSAYLAEWAGAMNAPLLTEDTAGE